MRRLRFLGRETNIFPETTLAEIRQELAQQEEREAAEGQVALHKMSASAFILWGMKIEEQQ